ncbi:hypothetical protein G6F57_017757 [Rhizopus arrhizus]|nr:hypothetical protein G6F57_017757 [Rhizopus arrhizus]
MVRRRGVAQACAERAPGVPVSAEGGNARRPHCRAAPVAAHSRGAERHRFAGCAHPAAPSLRRHGHPEQSVQQQADRHRPLRNDKYWQPERPYLDRIVWKIIPDVSGRATALETGGVAYGERNPVAFTDATRLSKLPKLAVDTSGYNGFAAWLWLEANLRDPILSNLKVRQAIAHAVNKHVLVKTVWNGYAEPFLATRARPPAGALL